MENGEPALFALLDSHSSSHNPLISNLDSRFSILNSLFSIPHSQFSILNSQFSIPTSHFPPPSYLTTSAVTSSFWAAPTVKAFTLAYSSRSIACGPDG